jgi:hypothetical protein
MKYVLLGALFVAGTLAAADKPKQSDKARSSDMQRAIAFERYKDLAAARQARKEARHPSVPQPSADRSADREDKDSSTVRDPGPEGTPRK